jgi:hypothetical protein
MSSTITATSNAENSDWDSTSGSCCSYCGGHRESDFEVQRSSCSISYRCSVKLIQCFRHSYVGNTICYLDPPLVCNALVIYPGVRPVWKNVVIPKLDPVFEQPIQPQDAIQSGNRVPRAPRRITAPIPPIGSEDRRPLICREAGTCPDLGSQGKPRESHGTWPVVHDVIRREGCASPEIVLPSATSRCMYSWIVARGLGRTYLGYSPPIITNSRTFRTTSSGPEYGEY